MKIFLTILFTVIVVGFIFTVASAQVVNCPCGYGEAGCLTCEEKAEDIKPVQGRSDPDTTKNCECGYDTNDDCIPCGNTQPNQ